MFEVWRKYFVDPAAYACDYTRWSRNFLNLGVIALCVSWFFIPFISDIRFAFSEISENQVLGLTRVDGEWLYIGGRNSMRAGIVVPGTEQFLAYADPFIAQPGPHSIRKPASGYVFPDRGIVRMDVEGVTVVAVSQIQAHLRRRIYAFVALVGFAVVMFVTSAARQFQLVKHQGPTK